MPLSQRNDKNNDAEQALAKRAGRGVVIRRQAGGGNDT
jgi:hypothetical protein